MIDQIASGAEPEEPRRVSIVWNVPSDVAPRYATNFVVQASDNEFRLYFFDIKPPMTIGTPEEQRQQLDQLQSVTAECVASLVVAPARMGELVTLLQGYFERYKTEVIASEETTATDPTGGNRNG